MSREGVRVETGCEYRRGASREGESREKSASREGVRVGKECE